MSLTRVQKSLLLDVKVHQKTHDIVFSAYVARLLKKGS